MKRGLKRIEYATEEPCEADLGEEPTHERKEGDPPTEVEAEEVRE